MSWIARISTNMREVRINYCIKSDSSRGVRDFIDKNYIKIKRLNPLLPFLVRPGNGGDIPRFTVRYDYGGEAVRDLTNLSEPEITEKLRELVEIGSVAIKANLYPWQESYLGDKDIVDYDPEDPTMHATLQKYNEPDHYIRKSEL